MYGYLRWKLHRATEHQPSVLAALYDDLRHYRPDHIAVTGDLTHLSLPSEFLNAKKWLHSLGPPDRVTAIPGNHDAYVHTNWSQTYVHWVDYMLSDIAPRASGSSTTLSTIFPSLRVRGPVALIGVCTANPCAPYLAVGRIGRDQLQKIKEILGQTRRQNLFRIILIHHPPAPGTVSWRKRLTDASEFRSLLRRHGSELILHGHAHHAVRNHLPIPSGSVPVVGAPSASAHGRNHLRMARSYVYRIISGSSGWRVKLTIRVYSPKKKRLVTESEEQFITSNKF
jgi:3',5'-cyclic AMP phosphodiesterase CpdA